jgi:hypothetical protein
MELAYADMYAALARIFSPRAEFRFQLHDTDFKEDVAMFHDFFSPFPASRRGIRVLVT